MTEQKKKLPKLKTPVFETILPVSKDKVRYRGFTTKEQKIMLIAKETEDVDDALLATEQIVTNCVVDEIDIESLSIVDFAWLLIAIRSKSVNDKIVVVFKDDETEEEIKAAITLDNTLIKYPEDKTDYSIVDVGGTKIFLKHPGWRTFKELLKDQNSAEAQYNALVNSFDKIVDGDDVYSFGDFDDEELERFIDELPDEVPAQLEKFYESGPQMRHELVYKRPSDGAEKKLVIEGFNAFFT